MIPIQLGDRKVLLVKVPATSKDFFVDRATGHWRLAYKTETSLHWIEKYLPPREKGWQILGTGTADRVKESEWAMIMETIQDTEYTKDWMYSYDGIVWRETATESGLSLLTSHNLKPEETVILVKQ